MSVTQPYSYLRLNSNISAHGQNFKILVNCAHCIPLINHHAKFQPPSSNNLGAVWGDTHKLIFSMIHYEISTVLSSHALLRLLMRDNQIDIDMMLFCHFPVCHMNQFALWASLPYKFIATKMDENKTVIVYSIDLSAAFDMLKLDKFD